MTRSQAGNHLVPLSGGLAEMRENVKTKEYIRPMPVTWFLRNRYLISYAIRELTSVFVAGYAIFLMVVLAYQNQGRQAFGVFFRTVLESPVSLILHLIVLGFVVFHSLTSFNGMGRVMVIRRGEERISPTLIAEANYALWIIVSALIFIGVIFWADAFERATGN
jgi:fumarate reductase subunit C